MRILFFFFSILAALLLCFSALACKLFTVTAKDVPPLEVHEIVTLRADEVDESSEQISEQLLIGAEKETEDAAILATETADPVAKEPSMTVLRPLIPKNTQSYESPSASVTSDRDYEVTVLVNGEDVCLSLHDYLIGVLLAELPMGFCDNARYAQAVAARSYIVFCVESGRRLGPTSCAYFTEERARRAYTHLYDTAYAQAKAAVEATDGVILTYGEDVCMAAFHAMSYGQTEASSEVWNEDMPYLVPVETPEDIELGGMETEYTFTEAELSALLGSACKLPMTLSLTDGGRVETVIFASGESYAGTKIRTALSLRATAFSIIKQDKKSVTLRVLGYGHGVGMSQWGAQMMALDGYSWQDILMHYYRGALFDTLASREKT